MRRGEACQHDALSPEQLADHASPATQRDKKAIDIVVLDLRGVAGYTDFFVICSGNTDRQAKAIHDGIHLGLKNEHGLLPRRVEGVREARWILMDYLDVVVHVFTPETRDFYRLEALWGDVPARDLDPVELPLPSWPASAAARRAAERAGRERRSAHRAPGGLERTAARPIQARRPSPYRGRTSSPSPIATDASPSRELVRPPKAASSVA